MATLLALSLELGVASAGLLTGWFCMRCTRAYLEPRMLPKAEASENGAAAAAPPREKKTKVVQRTVIRRVVHRKKGSSSAGSSAAPDAASALDPVPE